MTSQLLVVEETRVPGENNRQTPSHWQLSHIPQPGFEPVYLEFGILSFITTSAILRLSSDYSQLLMVMETRVKNTGNLLTCPGWDLNLCSGERQLAVSGNILDHSAIRAALSRWPCWFHLVRQLVTTNTGLTKF